MSTEPASPSVRPSAAEPAGGSGEQYGAKGEWERRALEQIVEGLRVRFGATSLAVYADDDGCRQLVAGAGATVLPSCLDQHLLPEAGEDGSPLVAHRLTGGLLVQQGGRAPAADELTVLVMTLRASVLAAELKRAAFTAKYRGVELEAVHDVGLAIASTLDVARIAEEALLRAVSLLDARSGALYVEDEGTLELQRVLGGEAQPTLAADDERIAGLSAKTGDSLLELVPGAEHVLAAPVRVDTGLRGLLLVADKESRKGIEPFGPEDFRTLSLFANHTAIALENARLHRKELEKERLERDVSLAADIQRRLLPSTMPEVEGVEVVGWNRPARHVGGDYFDVRERDGHLVAAVADVAGKGLPAALLVSTLHSALRLLSDQTTCSDVLLGRVDRHLADASGSNKFVTLLAVELDPATGDLEYCNAGHNPGLVIRADGTLDRLQPGGLPLGIFPGSDYKVGRMTLNPGDLVCLFSDGITECEGPASDECGGGEEYGEERLVDLLREGRELPLDELLVTIDRAVVAYACGLPQGDDQTVVLVRLTA